MAAVRALLAVFLLALPCAARADRPSLPESQRAQLEELRTEVGGQLQLQAYDLLDELVYGWSQTPVFGTETPVVLAGVSVPVGNGSGLEALLENHFFSLVLRAPQGRVRLAHCPQCSARVVHSGAKGTILSRGVDTPEALSAAAAGAQARHALFLDFEIEGSALVLRARITALEPALPLVYARTLSLSTSTPALLRSGEQLKSAAQAHQEYVDTLAGRGLFVVPFRLGIRTYANGSAPTARTPPLIWLMAGFETGLTQAKAWTGSVSLGFSWLPQSHTAWMGQARVSRLLTGSAVSLTAPDLYLFIGGSVAFIQGISATHFTDQPQQAEEPENRRASLGSYQVGLEVRVRNRLGLSAYLEASPALNDLPTVGSYIDLGVAKFQSFGVEVTFCF